MNINFRVTNQKLVRTSFEQIVENSINYLFCNFEFSEDWNECSKNAYFSQNGTIWYVSEVNDENICEIPIEVIKHTGFRMYLVARDVNNNMKITTNIINLNVELSGNGEGEKPSITDINSETLNIERQGNIVKIEIKDNYTTDEELQNAINENINLTNEKLTNYYTKSEVDEIKTNINEKINNEKQGLTNAIESVNSTLNSRIDNLSSSQEKALENAINDVKNDTANTYTTKVEYNTHKIEFENFVKNVNALLSSDDTTLDTLQEIVNYIKNNKDLLDGITVNKINYSDIVDNLETALTNKVLSANQGVVLKQLIDELNNSKVNKETVGQLNNLTTTNKSNVVESINEVNGKQNFLQPQKPKGTYENLSALQTAYPNGASSVYLTSDNGHWYYWNGSAWTDGGVYQTAVNYDELENEINTIKDIFEWESATLSNSKKWYTDSTENTETYNSSKELNVSNYSFIKISGNISKYYNAYTFLDEQNTVISYYKNMEDNFSLDDEILKVPSNAVICNISCGPVNLASISVDVIYKQKDDIMLDDLPIQSVEEGYYNTSSVYNSENSYRIVNYDVSIYNKVFISYNNFENYLPTYLLWKDGQIVFNSQNLGSSYEGWIDTTKVDKISIMSYYTRVGKHIVKSYTKTATKSLSYWNGKKIVWFGTSIPAGGLIGTSQTNTYPSYVGNMLGANVYNEAVGGSALHCKRYSRVTETNPYGFNANFASVSEALASNLVEKQWIINWAKAYLNGGNYVSGYVNDCAFDGTVFTTNLPTTMSSDDENFIKDCSYERKLDKYLGNGNRCDLYVIDHGYNDYTLEENNFSESSPFDLNYFRGAMNFIIARILGDNPRAKIVILTHYTDQIPTSDYNGNLTKYQVQVADDWNLQRLELYKMLGFSTKYKINTEWGFMDGYLFDNDTIKNVTVKSRWMQDDLHPHSDLSNECITYIARTISAWLDNEVRSGW